MKLRTPPCGPPAAGITGGLARANKKPADQNQVTGLGGELIREL